MAQYTPMIQQYLQIKSEYHDCILFFRLGDFYEMFFEDAEYASQTLDITLTSRDAGRGMKIPMCGVPYHSADVYIAKLIADGCKVAICEQVGDAGVTKGLVKREVVRVVTPGTVVENELLEPDRNNYMMSLSFSNDQWGYSCIDISTGEFLCGTVDIQGNCERLHDVLLRFVPRELVISRNIKLPVGVDTILQSLQVLTTTVDEITDRESMDLLCNQFGVLSLNCFGIEEYGVMVRAAARLLQYLSITQKVILPQITGIQVVQLEDYMIIDHITRKNLEVTETIIGGKRRGSLLWLLRQTKTSMGHRLVNKWVLNPLRDIEAINQRLSAVEWIVSEPIVLEELQTLMKKICDIERILGKAAAGKANARDLVALKKSIKILPAISQQLIESDSIMLREIADGLKGLDDLASLLERSLETDPPTTLKEGDIIKSGYDADVDHLRSAQKEGKDWIASLEQKERERTRIKSLKVGFNKVFGYYIEVTKANLRFVPSDYIRKQTLANAERYFTTDLKNWETRILESEEKLTEKELEVFLSIRSAVVSHAAKIQEVAEAIASLDVVMGFAILARKHAYVRPEMHSGYQIVIESGRHPVVERVMNKLSFVPNDTNLDTEQFVHIITGPNMAGKSTYMRQVALIVLMAQIGSFVPAKYAQIGVIDRLFTRVGAADDIFSGQSTFMVEMAEVANICNNATGNSLVILDEIGRGTSTFDGMSIAKAVVEYIYRNIKCKTLFATHYHELTGLERDSSGIANYCVAVHDSGSDVAFLRKIVRGFANKSYGVHVAKLAGVPDEVVKSASQFLEELEGKSLKCQSSNTRQAAATSSQTRQLNIFAHPIIEELRCLNPHTVTPLDALKLIYRWKEAVEE